MIQLKKLFKFIVILPITSLLLLTGCAQVNEFSSIGTSPFANPAPNAHSEQELMIVQIGQLLSLDKISTQERAELHFERGVLYDSLGLWTLARNDFNQALSLQPKMAAVHNYLGLYLLLDEDYDHALDEFNSVLSIDPHYEYTFLNRGLNFYYMGRYDLAEKDLLSFYQENKADPYRVLWLYLNELKLKPTEAYPKLTQRAENLSSEYWGTNIVQYYLGNLSLEDLQNKASKFARPQSSQDAEILTETYFYLAKQKLNTDHTDEAIALFKLAMANQVYNFVEYRFALFELNKLKNTQTTQAVVTP